MAAPAFRSQTNDATGTGTNFAISKPTGVVDGDLLIVAFATYDSSGTMAHGTPPAGWNTLRQLNETTDKVRTSIYWKIAAGEGSGWTFTKTNDAGSFGGCIGCLAISNPGVPATPISSEDGVLDTSSNTSLTAPSVTPARSTDLLVYIGSCRGSASSFTAPPAGFTERFAAYSVGQDTRLEAATKAAGAGGATGTLSATLNLADIGSAFAIVVADAAPAVAAAGGSRRHSRVRG